MPPMRRQPATDTLLFIPADIVEAYQDQAALQVRETWVGRPPPALAQDAVRPHPEVRELHPPRTAAATSWTSSPWWAASERFFLTLAVLIALVGWAVCTGWWAWLAYDTGSTTWITIALAGSGALVLGVVTSLRLWLRRHEAYAALNR